MKVLLDTNIIIHRETHNVINSDIGVLFKWLDNLHYSKHVHPITVQELNNYKNTEVKKAFDVKLGNYNILRTEAPMHPNVIAVSQSMDKTTNDINDSRLLNELFNQRVDFLITEDKKILSKAALLGIANKVYTIESFLEKVTIENPSLVDYRILSVKREFFGNINLSDAFFDSFKEDYPGFQTWFNKKSDETAYVCTSEDSILAFLYVKIEGIDENYFDIQPQFDKKKRLKIGTLKVTMTGYNIGERFLKIVFDNALRFKVDEIYVTAFDRTMEQNRLIRLLEDYGFKLHGTKRTSVGDEKVYVRALNNEVADRENPKHTYPFISGNANVFLAAIYPEYHTELFPDSILRTESPTDFIEHEPFRNAIGKVFVSRAFERNIQSGDIIIFYRTGGYYKSVVTTVGIVDRIVTGIKSEEEFIRLCRNRSVFSDDELRKRWNYKPYNRPFLVFFLYAYSFPQKINLKRLIEIGVIAGIDSVPRGFLQITRAQFELLMKEAQTDECIIVN